MVSAHFTDGYAWGSPPSRDERTVGAHDQILAGIEPPISKQLDPKRA